jgi:NAD(P)-dependent dehydrogenase (short-subunit alcohol dehydrogenase family)
VGGTVTGGSVLVTGAASGIGRGIARAAAAAGRRVVATDIDEPGLEDLALEGRRRGWSLVTTPLDVAEPKAIEAALAWATADGEPLGGLVHCAGITFRGPLLDMAVRDYHRVVETNLTGSFLCMTSAARAMVAQGAGGSIVVITSINAQRPLLSQAVYSACKAAVEVLVSTLALEVAWAGVRVNAVAPGAVDTAMNPKANSDPAGIARIPLGRLGTPEDIAGPVLFLLSDEARYITATSLAVDGGVVHLRP